MISFKLGFSSWIASKNGTRMNTDSADKNFSLEIRVYPRKSASERERSCR
jgi:hypothetical protein